MVIQEIGWQGIATSITALVALSSLFLSLYVVLRNKPKLNMEKIDANKKDEKLIEFRFYLDNIGEKPTTIKSIEFYTDDRFNPKNNIVSIIKETIPANRIVFSNKMESFNLPYHLLPNTSLKLKAQLDFSNEKERNEAIKPKGNQDQIHFTIVIKHSKGTFTKRI